VWQALTREKMLALQQAVETAGQGHAHFMGEQVLMFHEWMGTDDHWRGVAMLADGTRVMIEQRQ